MPVTSIVTKPLQTGIGIGRGAFGLSRGLVSFGLKQATGLLQRNGDDTAAPETAVPETAVPTYPSEGSVEVAVDEFGAVGSLTDNTGVEPDGTKPPFPGYDKLSGDRVMAHVTESTDLPDLQVLLAYEEAHKNRKGVVQAVEARLSALGAPAS